MPLYPNYFLIIKIVYSLCVCVWNLQSDVYFTLKLHLSLHWLHVKGSVATWGSGMVLESTALDHQAQTFQSRELIIAMRAKVYWALAEYQGPW